MIFLTRKAEFSSAHYYWNDAWSPEKNQQVFGKCANRNGHGHNYTLEVTVAGEIDPVTGFVVDLKELKDILESEGRQRLRPPSPQPRSPRVQGRHPHHRKHRHRHLAPPRQQIPNAKLHRVRVYEMPDLFADYYGEP